MGKLWQKTDNTVFNEPLLALRGKIESGSATSDDFLSAIRQARDTARSQSLQRTEAQLKQFEKGAPSSADLADPDKRQNMLKQIDRLIRNAQVREVDLSTFRVNGPIMIYLSGFLTNNDRNDFALGGIKRAEELFRGRPEVERQPETYGWTHTDLSNLFNLAAYDTFPGTRASRAGYQLAEAVFMPLVTRGFEAGKNPGTPLPLDEARANLRNVTLFGYSAGTIVAQEIYNAATRLMRKSGFKDEEISILFKEVVLLAVGNISRPSKETDRYTTLTLVATNDRIMRAKNWIWGTLGSTFRKLKDILTLRGWHKNSRDFTIRPLSGNYLFASASARKSLYEWNYDGDGNRIAKRPFDPLIPEWALIRSYHEVPHYMTMDDSNNAFARIAHYALINAFNRKGLVTPGDLMKPSAADTHPAEKQEAYRKRIDDAMRPMPRSMM